MKKTAFNLRKEKKGSKSSVLDTRNEQKGMLKKPEKGNFSD